jgi:hypothetical protein
MQHGCLFAPRFLDKFVGKAILSDPKVATMELVANSWDAGATLVDITWPSRADSLQFSIQDDGVGMTEVEFTNRWRTLAYDRIVHQGKYAEWPEEYCLGQRKAFGRNGVGRFAGFCFGDSYIVDTAKGGRRVVYRVSSGNGDSPFTLIKISEEETSDHGTKIYVDSFSNIHMTAEQAIAEIGMRFLTDPSFNISVNGEIVVLQHIPDRHLFKETISIDNLGIIEIIAIDTLETDRTTKQHGIAWHVNGRLVGECSWKWPGLTDLIDGRRIEAKRYIFIVQADFLAHAVNQEWTGFCEDNIDYQNASEKIFQQVKQFILAITQRRRNDTLIEVAQTHEVLLSRMGRFKKERWTNFVSTVQKECPSITETDLTKLSGILANLELAESKYTLISQLHSLEPSQLEDLHKILEDWSIDFAKEVLDELRIRMQLLDELKVKVFDKNADEVHELQPLFRQGLWIFGPEYETIEFTSNEGMTSVIQKLLDVDEFGSRNRPDFAIIPDGSVGSYYYPSYDESGSELGVARLVIVELKKPGVKIGDDAINQCWKYVRELYSKGILQEITKVTCFVLGSNIDPISADVTTKKAGKVIIQPLSYATVIDRAKSRLLKLYDRVSEAPFLKGIIMDENFSPETQQELDLTL